jgi:hypothetical protein
MEHTFKNVFHLFLVTFSVKVNILITKDDFKTLVDVVITNMTYLNMVQCVSSMTMQAMTFVIQEETQSYIKR